MNPKHAIWYEQAQESGWVMPRSPRVLRWPVIRHIRVMWLIPKVDKHTELWRAAGLVNTGYDYWVLYGLMHGLEN